jgi:hypothetical protein
MTDYSYSNQQLTPFSVDAPRTEFSSLPDERAIASRDSPAPATNSVRPGERPNQTHCQSVM